jgi:hypothetical protein
MKKLFIQIWEDLKSDNPTKQQLKNRLKIQQLKQNGIKFLNDNPLIIPFCLGLIILAMTIILAISIH